MKKLLVVSALAATALTSFTAQADGRWPNWYVGLHGSLAFVEDVELDSNPVIASFAQDQGFGYGVSLGYRPATNNPIFNKFRFELEWHHQGAGVDKVDSKTSGSFNGDGTVRLNAGMGNVYYDFVMADANGQTKALAPYIGAGFGWASVTLDGTSATLGNVSDNDDVMAWQLMAGLSYAPQFLPYTEWTLGYRYFDTANPRYSYLGVSNFDADVASHNLEAGVHFLF